MKDRRLTTTLGVAIVAHALVMVLTRRAPLHERRSTEARPADGESQVEIDLTPVVVPPSSIEAVATPPMPHGAVAAARAEGAGGGVPGRAAGIGAARSGDEAGERSNDGMEGAADAAGASGLQGWSFNPVRAENRLPSSEHARHGAVRTEPEPHPTYGVAEALDARDGEIGLARSGPLLVATEEAAREAGPMDGRAVFGVSVDRDHNVIVTLERAERSSEEAWRAVLEVVKRKAKGKSVRIPPTAKGVYARIEIESSVVWPDGRKLSDTRKAASASAHGVTIQDDAQGGTLTTPQAEVRLSGKICTATFRVPGVRIGHGGIEILDPIVGSCSFENAGAAGQHIVHGRIVTESRL